MFTVLLTLLAAALGLAVVGAIGVLVLVKLGVLTGYAVKPERPEDKQGEFGLAQSQEAGRHRNEE